MELNKDDAYLNEMSIHQLRNFARKCGVKAPTTLKKSEIIEEINKIKTGEKEPVAFKMGRKPKESGFGILYHNEFSLNSPMFEYGTENSIKEGRVKLYTNTYPKLHIEEDNGQVIEITITPDIIRKHSIKKDDILTVELRPMKNEYNYVIENVLKINGINVEEYDSDKYLNIETTINTEDTIKFESNNNITFENILKGTSNFIRCSFNEIKDVCASICNNLNKENLKVILLNANTQNISKIDDIEIVNLNIEESFSNLFKHIILTQEKARKCFIDGNQVVFIICDLCEIIKIINYNQQNAVTNEITPETITSIRKLTNMSKYVDHKSNLTTIILDCLNSKYSQIVQDDILKNITNYFEVK